MYTNQALVQGTKVEAEHKPTYKWLEQYIKTNKKLPPERELYSKIASDHLRKEELYYDILAEVGL